MFFIFRNVAQNPCFLTIFRRERYGVRMIRKQNDLAHLCELQKLTTLLLSNKARHSEN